MGTLTESILNVLAHTNGLTDREITTILRGYAANQQPVNAACRQLAARGELVRRTRSDGRIGNFLAKPETSQRRTAALPSQIQKMAASSAGDSLEQRTAEAILIESLANKLGVRLTKKKLRLPDGGWLELDGASDSPPIMCEA